MRIRPIALSVLLACTTPAFAQLSITFGGPGVSIGINLPVYPTLQRIPGYPVYYAPSVHTNYFFYDGLYWVFDDDNWYASSWYNGPWTVVDRYNVPVYLLRVPVRYYRHAPSYFHGWRQDAPPRWNEHWGSSWEQRRSGWDNWNRNSAPAPAPLPTYQRQYSGDRYPRQVNEQAAINTRNYRYQPQDPVAREHFQYQRSQAQSAPAPAPTPYQQYQQRAPQEQPRQQPPQMQQQQQPVQQQPMQQQPRQRTQQEQPPQQAQPPKISQPAPQAQQPQRTQPPQQPPQANPAARAQRPEAAPDKGAQGKGKEQGKGEEKGKGHDKEKDKDKQER